MPVLILPVPVAEIKIPFGILIGTVMGITGNTLTSLANSPKFEERNGRRPSQIRINQNMNQPGLVAKRPKAASAEKRIPTQVRTTNVMIFSPVNKIVEVTF